MKMIVNPEYKQYTAMIESIPKLFDTSGRTIYKNRNEIKVFDMSGIAINVKRYKAPFFINRIIYTFFRKTKAQRAYSYALRLLAKGFDTPSPIAYILYKKKGLICHSYFISMQSSCQRDMYEFGKGLLSGRESIISSLARYTSMLHDSGVYHNDYSPGNILFQQTGEDVKFTLVDINRMRFHPVSIQKGCANFARLWGGDDMFRLLAREYAVARHSDIADCTRWVFLYRKRFWKKYTRKHEMPFEL